MKGKIEVKQVGFALILIVAIAMILGSFGMIFPKPESAREFSMLNINDKIQFIGFIKLIIAGLLLAPKTRHIAALLVTGYLGGAMMATLTMGFFPWIAGLFILVLWIGMELMTGNFLKLPCICNQDGKCFLCKFRKGRMVCEGECKNHVCKPTKEEAKDSN